jgi:hypothetical protein
MNAETKIKRLKIAFWTGAITDALAAIIMVFPQLKTLFLAQSILQ